VFTLRLFEQSLFIPSFLFSSLKYRLITGFVVFFAVLVSGAVLIIFPHWQTLSQVTQELGLIKEQVSQKKVNLVKHNQLLKAQQALKKSLNPYFTKQPIYLVTIKFVTQIEQWCKLAGIPLNKVNWGSLNQKTHFQSQSINFLFIGQYQQIISLLHYIGQNHTFVEINDVKISATSNKDGVYNKKSQLSFELKVNIVLLKNTNGVSND